jgi:hypothetical protein
MGKSHEAARHLVDGGSVDLKRGRGLGGTATQRRGPCPCLGAGGVLYASQHGDLLAEDEGLALLPSRSALLGLQLLP